MTTYAQRNDIGLNVLPSVTELNNVMPVIRATVTDKTLIPTLYPRIAESRTPLFLLGNGIWPNAADIHERLQKL